MRNSDIDLKARLKELGPELQQDSLIAMETIPAQVQNIIAYSDKPASSPAPPSPALSLHAEGSFSEKATSPVPILATPWVNAVQ